MITLAMVAFLICVYATVASWAWEWSGLHGHPFLVRVVVTAAVASVGLWVFAAWLAWVVIGRQKGPLVRARARAFHRRKATVLAEMKAEERREGITPAEAMKQVGLE